MNKVYARLTCIIIGYDVRVVRVHLFEHISITYITLNILIEIALNILIEIAHISSRTRLYSMTLCLVYFVHIFVLCRSQGRLAIIS